VKFDSESEGANALVNLSRESGGKDRDYDRVQLDFSINYVRPTIGKDIDLTTHLQSISTPNLIVT
jgi:hypothetical protein